VPGPHTERFAPGAFASLATASFTVESESNRVGLLLQPGGDPPWAPLAGGVTAELDSQGTVVGAVQIPPNGHPVILLPDHATLGGYPVLAVVAAADHGLLGQCAPGMRVVLVPIDHGEARDAQRARRRDMETAVVGRYPLAVD
jgi:allophanate hydrolase subunit 2